MKTLITFTLFLVFCNFSFGQRTYKSLKDSTFKPNDVILLNHIFFHIDRPQLLPPSFEQLDSVVILMKKHPELIIEIGGHTDNRGSDKYCISLTQRRAQSICNFLIEKGVLARRLVARGYGESIPIATNETEKGRQQNRRIEIKVLAPS